MIIIKVNGGLGNQLQQYALYDKLRSMGKEVKLDLSWFKEDMVNTTSRKLELNYFPKVNYQVATKEEVKAIIGKRNIVKKGLEKLHIITSPYYIEHQMYDPDIFKLDHKILEGYWACEGYYADRIKDLWEQLEFVSNLDHENEKMKEKMQGCNSVSIHIRRGDYLKEENQKLFGGICTDKYYEAAISRSRELVENPHFFVFSDDFNYIREHYGKKEFTPVNINHGSDSYLDIYLMSQCKHNICANSTFSFWGARLNQNEEKLMIRPLKQKNCDWYEPDKMKQLWKGWTLIDEDGRER